MNLIQQIEAEEIAKSGKDIPEFRAGDTVRVGVKVKEGNRERIQAYEGVVIARSNRGMGSNFTVRKMSFGEGVERVFPLYSPIVESITVVRRGVVRRAKLYYLRGRTGKSARIAERRDNRAVSLTGDLARFESQRFTAPLDRYFFHVKHVVSFARRALCRAGPLIPGNPARGGLGRLSAPMAAPPNAGAALWSGKTNAGPI